MSTWNYRPVRREQKSGLDDSIDVWWGLYEVYYFGNGKPRMMASDPEVVADSREELIKALEMMLKDAREREPFDPPTGWLQS